jgi:bacterioferritin
MKGDSKVIADLNFILKDELTAVSQYIVHSEMCANWGYKKLSTFMKMRAIAEMKHAEAIIERIIFLEGIPELSNLNTLHIGKDVLSMHENDHDAEEGAIETYNDAIATAVGCSDNGTRKLLESHLSDEENHINVIEEHLAQIEQMGLENYLVEQI